jgi:hypothetical protein
VQFENAHAGRHVLSIDEFAALLARNPDLTNLNKLMENMRSDIKMMDTKRRLLEAKAKEQMLARRARAAAAPDAPDQSPSPTSRSAGQGQEGEGGADSDPMGFESPQDHELAAAQREAFATLRVCGGRTSRRSGLPDDDDTDGSLDAQARIVNHLEMEVNMGKDMSLLTAKYFGCRDEDELLNYIYENSLHAFSTRLISLMTAPAFQLVAEALGHKYQEPLAPTGDGNKLEHILQTIKDFPGPVTLATIRALRSAHLAPRGR